VNLNKLLSRLSLGVALVLSAVTVFGQGYPLPSSGTVLCANCPGRNAMGQLNAGLPLWPWSSPIKAFVGRYVDSVVTGDDQGHGMRTARAGRVKVAATQRGTAPPRVYMQVGAALSAYKLDTFFTQKLPAGMVDVDSYSTGITYGRPGSGVLEKVLSPEAFVYPESPMSGWLVNNVDSQERLFDFDWDDRGYIYAAYSICGWGIIKDDGKTDGGMLPKVSQRLGDLPNDVSLGVKSIVSLKTSNGQYYAVISDPEAGGVSVVYNVSDAANPLPPVVLKEAHQAVRYWAKNATGDRLAFVDRNFDVQVYNVDTFIAGGSPLATFQRSAGGRLFFGVAGDNQGNFWGVESAGNQGSNVLWRFSPSGGTFVAQSFDVYGGQYNPVAIESNDGYITVTGFEGATEASGSPTQTYDPRLYKIEASGPKLIDLKDYFRNYYHHPPTGYAKPDGYTRLVRSAVTVKQNNKLYFIYASHGLGDVYELAAGDSISVTQGTTFGTPNPRSQATQTGPFYGDPITFTATNGAQASLPLPLTWDFGNPEFPTTNSALSTTGQSVTHTYGGLTSAAAIAQPRSVSAKVTVDPSVLDTTTVNLKVPTPRVIVNGPNTVLAASSSGHEFVFGDTFADASDGSIESHYNVWTIGNTTTSGTPSVTPAVGPLGAQTLTFTANYGPYNLSTLAPMSPGGYAAQVANINYTVKPFIVKMEQPTANGNSYTFKGSARRTTDATIILPTATTWGVTWSVKKNSVDVVPPQVSPTAPIGTIPDFNVNGVSAATLNGATLSLTVAIPDAGLAAAALPFKSTSLTSSLVTPDPVVTRSGCDNTGSACTFTVTSASSASMSDWQYSWTMTGPGGNVSGSAATFSPSISAPGNYTVNLTVTKSIFSAGATPVQWAAQGPLCGPLPTANQMFISVLGLASGCTSSGSTPCAHGENIVFKAQAQQNSGYQIQTCDNFSWNFGDGTTGTGSIVNHSFSAGASATVTLTVTNAHGSVPFTKTVSFTATNPGGGGNPNECTAPTSPTIAYSGSLGCGVNVACKTGEIITFVASRTGGLQSCDTVNWNFGDGTSTSGAQVQKAFTAPSAGFNVSMTITNEKGTSPAASQVIVVTENNNQGGSCALPAQHLVSFSWVGTQTNCTPVNGTPCGQGEAVQFTARWTNGQFRSCDRFEWDFGDGATSTQQNPSHVFASGSAFNVKLRIHNDAGQTLNPIIREVIFSGGAAKPVPTITISAAQTSGRNSAVVFTATSSLPNTTGWTWDFGDGNRDLTQSVNISQTSTVIHAFNEARDYVVTVSARNSESPASAQAGSRTHQITIVSTPEHRFLLPVVTHAPGQNSSVWRTDVQVFNSDPNVSAANPLVLKVSFKGQERQINVTSSTYIDEDFLRHFTNGNDSGAAVVSVQSDYRPQIWTRTYNKASNGTFGQFIPAISLDDSTSATALPTTETFLYLPGLRSSTRYRTNVGLVNPMPSSLTVTITAYDDEARIINSVNRTVGSFELVQFNVVDAITSGIPASKPYTIRVTVPANNWMIAYGSMIDMASNDPTYISAISDSELSAPDYGDLIVPGVGRTGLWRSDVTIFNPGTTIDDEIIVDLAYYDATGAVRGEAKNVKIRPRQLLQLNDLLQAGILTPQPAAGTGVLRVRTTSGWTTKYPLAYSRTYNDNGAVTFGQGIPSFAAARANVKANQPAIIPAVRHDSGNNGYYTNLGLVNLTDKAVRVKVTLLREDTGANGGEITYDLNPYASQIGQIFPTFPGATRGTLKIEIVGNGSVWAFASTVDKTTTDPEYIAAVPAQQ
jgi:PKD repeat protein